MFAAYRDRTNLLQVALYQVLGAFSGHFQRVTGFPRIIRYFQVRGLAVKGHSPILEPFGGACSSIPFGIRGCFRKSLSE